MSSAFQWLKKKRRKLKNSLWWALLAIKLQPPSSQPARQAYPCRRAWGKGACSRER